ncbi:unnamed protein product [Blepharisma stoltei]|uniref:Uncharacterized protein n=1 Tax=Blepharisma stoltei TaxID=1481888 RepID=A0AAU9IB28_9CILI|nr:unnamed protein product [Blepharisma stoltei]
MNLIMYVDKKDENQILIDRALYINNRVYMRLRPVIEKGIIDPRYYRIKINLDYRLSTELAIIDLEKKMKDMGSGNWDGFWNRQWSHCSLCVVWFN